MLVSSLAADGNGGVVLTVRHVAALPRHRIGIALSYASLISPCGMSVSTLPTGTGRLLLSLERIGLAATTVDCECRSRAVRLRGGHSC